ncbi:MULTISPECIES: aminotransferase class I/II-fold pyridoxal phosphate-dependent enzyme [Roseomonadaceae]|uniref:Aminotransferase class I/II-fold pyridoxal phosphate-dependent enzyme n=1 Tax=Falsiroseomonas oleicola TaxID=2801474 RepID=A0ABS6H2J2_9PROT|nr:aminotransferase class I/II-fold pyridoxal phosphate-dependent enzyme [Roseomonas oleicola]MBU8542601.1 aminotransferase class I/II-fold pyridoxal phosphate-dependent enzyme [Roseomonas oleicola]
MSRGQGFGLSNAARLALVQRLAKRREGQEAQAASDHRGFGAIQGLRDWGLMREAMGALAIESPFFRVHEGRAGAHSLIGNRETLNFGSYDYLGLNGDPRLHQAAAEAMARYGISASASRLVSGERPVHGVLEQRLAALYGQEAALAFVSGHATNVTVIGHLMGPRDVIVHDAAIHNSCVEGAKLSGARRVSFPHNDVRAAEREMASVRRSAGRALLLVEGHYSMDGDVPDLAALVRIARKHDAWLMVDDAHGLGCVGATGKGVFEAAGVDPAEVDIWMGTLSKTLCAAGGYIAARADLIDWLRHTVPGFVYSVGLSPPLAASAAAALDVMLAEPWRVAKLQANARLFRDLCRQHGFDTGASEGLSIVPVVLGSSVRAVRVAVALLEHGVNALPIVFPAVPEKLARLRFFLSAEHSEQDVRDAVAALVAATDGVAPADLAG